MELYPLVLIIALPFAAGLAAGLLAVLLVVARAAAVRAAGFAALLVPVLFAVLDLDFAGAPARLAAPVLVAVAFFSPAMVFSTWRCPGPDR